MNNKETELYRIMNIAISCCTSNEISVSIEDIKGKSRQTVLVWIRAIIVTLLASHGYLTSSIAKILNRTTPSIRYLMNLDSQLKRTSKAYKIASEEAMLLCKNILP